MKPTTNQMRFDRALNSAIELHSRYMATTSQLSIIWKEQIRLSRAIAKKAQLLAAGRPKN